MRPTTGNVEFKLLIAYDYTLDRIDEKHPSRLQSPLEGGDKIEIILISIKAISCAHDSHS